MTERMRFALLYAGLAAAHLLTEWWWPDRIYLTKPLLLLALSIHWWRQTARWRHPSATLMQVALAFAWLGDVLLLAERRHPLFFLLGLSAFFVMQVLYAWIFGADFRRPAANQWWAIIGVGGFVGLAVSRIWPALPVGMRAPVGIYMVAITAMVYLALFRRGAVGQTSFVRVLMGALLFLLSDTCLALNRFLTVDAWVGGLVMPTYMLAQYLIVTGLLANRTEMRV